MKFHHRHERRFNFIVDLMKLAQMSLFHRRFHYDLQFVSVNVYNIVWKCLLFHATSVASKADRMMTKPTLSFSM